MRVRPARLISCVHERETPEFAARDSGVGGFDNLAVPCAAISAKVIVEVLAFSRSGNAGYTQDTA
jgi:hypothetical protein